MTQEQTDDVCQGIGSWIVTTAHAFRKSLECELAQQGVTYRQFEVLAWLKSTGEQPQNELADRMGLEAQTMAGIIARMERDGWLTRQCCSQDRRRKLMQISHKADKIWKQMYDCCQKIQQQAMQGLTEQDLLTLENICLTIRRNLEAPCPKTETEREAVMNHTLSRVIEQRLELGEETRYSGEETDYPDTN